MTFGQVPSFSSLMENNDALVIMKKGNVKKMLMSKV